MSDGPSGGIAARVFDLVPGLEWPAGDEQACRAAAMAWNEMSKAIGAVAVAAASARAAVTDNNVGDEIDAFAAFVGRVDGVFLPETAQACRQMAQALEQYAEQVAEAKHRIIVECTIAGVAIIAGIGLFAIPIVGQFAAASAAATAAALVATTGLIGVTLSATAASIAATILVGAVFGALSAVTIDLVVAQPIRMAFGDQAWLDWNAAEAVAWAKGGALGGGIAGGLGGAAQLSRALSPAMAASTPRLAAALDRLPVALQTRTGQVLAGTGVNAATGYALNGRVTGIDLLSGAAGGLAGHAVGRGGDRLPMLDAIESSPGGTASALAGRVRALNDLGSTMQTQGRFRKVSDGWTARAGVQQLHDAPYGGDIAVSTLSNGGRNLDVAIVDYTGHGLEVAPQSLSLSGQLQRILTDSPGPKFLSAANDHLTSLPVDLPPMPPAQHVSVDMSTGAFSVRVAGGDPALQYHAAGRTWTVLEPPNGPLLGLIDGVTWSPLDGTLQPGDAILIYSDGMVENRSAGSDPGRALLMEKAGPILSARLADPTLAILDAIPGYGDDRSLVVIQRPPG